MFTIEEYIQFSISSRRLSKRRYLKTLKSSLKGPNSLGFTSPSGRDCNYSMVPAATPKWRKAEGSGLDYFWTLVPRLKILLPHSGQN